MSDTSHRAAEEEEEEDWELKVKEDEVGGSCSVGAFHAVCRRVNAVPKENRFNSPPLLFEALLQYCLSEAAETGRGGVCCTVLAGLRD